MRPRVRDELGADGNNNDYDGVDYGDELSAVQLIAIDSRVRGHVHVTGEKKTHEISGTRHGSWLRR